MDIKNRAEKIVREWIVNDETPLPAFDDEADDYEMERHLALEKYIAVGLNDALEWSAAWIESSVTSNHGKETVAFASAMAESIRAAKANCEE